MKYRRIDKWHYVYVPKKYGEKLSTFLNIDLHNFILA